MNDVLIAGAAIVDILMQPVDTSLFSRNSVPVERAVMSTGGDAMNEALVLRRLGRFPALATLLGDDDAGSYIRTKLSEAGITPIISCRDGIHTSFNCVVVEPNGERHFITDPTGSMRKLSPPDLRGIENTAAWRESKVFSMASIFVSHEFGPPDTAALLLKAKRAGKTVCLDTTTPKNGETFEDIAGALAVTDYFFPNAVEAAMLTGQSDPLCAAETLLKTGVRNVIVKTGAKGCLIVTEQDRIRVQGWPGTNVIDSTGAGDTFAAAFIDKLLAGSAPAECAAFANAAASICAEHIGAATAALDPDDLKARADAILNRCESIKRRPF